MRGTEPTPLALTCVGWRSGRGLEQSDLPGCEVRVTLADLLRTGCKRAWAEEGSCVSSKQEVTVAGSKMSLVEVALVAQSVQNLPAMQETQV